MIYLIVSSDIVSHSPARMARKEGGPETLVMKRIIDCSQLVASYPADRELQAECRDLLTWWNHHDLLELFQFVKF